jgi:hypothetical protein
LPPVVWRVGLLDLEWLEDPQPVFFTAAMKRQPVQLDVNKPFPARRAVEP